MDLVLLQTQVDLSIQFLPELLIFFAMVVLALGLTAIAIYVSLIPFRMGASIAWLALLIVVVTNPWQMTDLSETWVRALAFLLVLMVVAPLVMQMRTEVFRQQSMGPPGSPSAGSLASFTKYEKSPPAAAPGPSPYDRYRSELRERLQSRARIIRQSGMDGRGMNRNGRR